MDNEKLVSPYVPAQFPFHYRENYPQLVEFVKMYYTWLEQSDQVIGHTRRLVEYRDVDETPEDYLKYFKDKYLPFIKFITDVDKRTLVKHVQDLYRSKGTERGIDLFFRLVYGVPAEVYYPGNDLFRLSDNSWIRKKYLEVSHSTMLRQFVGKKVIGTRSGATAFVEDFVTKKVGSTYVNLLFISTIEGDFKFNEKLTYDGLEVGNTKRPRVIGSLTSLDVTSGGRDFKVGDLVDINSNKGHGALGRVASVFNTTGLVDFTLVDGGWGYSQYANVFVSEKILRVQNVAVDYAVNNPDEAPYVSSPFFTLEKLYQPLANLDYKFDTSLQNLLVTKPASSWYANSAVVYQVNSTVNSAVGTIVSNSAVNSTAQNLVISVAKSNTQQIDFLVTSGDQSNLILGTNSSVNSVILSTNNSTNVLTIQVGTVLRSYNSTGGVISTVQIIDTQISNLQNRTANMYVHVVSGNAQLNTYFWAPSNTYSLNASAYVDKTATANVVGFGSNITMYVSNATTVFQKDQYITQRRTYPGGYDISAKARIDTIGGAGNTFTIELKEATGVFRRTVNVYMQTANGAESGHTAYLNSYDGYLAVVNIGNDFSSYGNNRVYTLGWSVDANNDIIIYGSNSVANAVTIYGGKNATFEVSNTFSYPETYSIFTDFVGGNNSSNQPYMNLTISNTTAFSNSLTLTFTAGVNSVAVSGGTADINLSTNWYVAGEGLSDFTEIISKNSTHIEVSPAPWNASNATFNYRLTPVSGIAWGFPKNTGGTVQYIVNTVLASINGSVGGITKLEAENPGEDYSLPPVVLVKDPYISGFNVKDYIITYSVGSRNFVVGERITQVDGAVGLIEQIIPGASTNILYVKRLSLPLGNTTLNTTFSMGEVITGVLTGANGTIVGIQEDDGALGLGLNAVISANVITGNGAVKTIDVLDSGFSFENNENATFISKDGLRAGTAKVSLLKQGITSGTFMDEASFLSNGKYLQDGEYYQEYSYDIKTSIARESYKDNFESTMHLAGTKMFSTFVHVAENDFRIEISLPESANLIANIV